MNSKHLSDVPSGAAQDVPDDHPHRCLSALVDGDAQAAQQGCNLWRSDAAARQAWHAYHLIGDVMRSDELACAPAHDAAFLGRLRGQLAAEPVLLAPEPLAPAPASRRQRWLVPAAVAAGFMGVAGALLVTQGGGPALRSVGGVLAAASGPQQQGLAQRRLVSDQGVIRDARLDEYLRAHQAARGGFGAAVPGGALRRVDVVVPASPDR